MHIIRYFVLKLVRLVRKKQHRMPIPILLFMHIVDCRSVVADVKMQCQGKISQGPMPRYKQCQGRCQGAMSR